ncbi:hypothetical protein DXG03_004924 [Asterophora parasitica]|uniref:Uncharacterized protein n=1 Tax=Asterophora parasitica TaxID=117018 RepID=A0A9P7GJU1_9AGAR|nr:hypothetical protein DXG03_004924 [Asterophora parasitica]
MLEEDLFFPGKLIDRDEDSEPDSASENRPLSHLNSTHSHSDTRAESIADSALLSTSSHTSDGASPLTPTTAAFPTTPSRSNSPVEPFTIEENEHEQEEAKDLLSQVIGDYHIPCKEPATQDDPAIDPATDVSDAVSPPTQRPPLQVKTPHKSRSLVSQPPGFAASAVSLIMSSVGSVAVPPDSLYELEPSLDSKGRVRPRGYSLTSSLPVPDSESRRGHSNSVPTSPHADIQSIPPVPPLLMTVPKPPANPRDHSLLAAIYGKLLESRFINISPLALLTNAMGLHFKDVRTHPPLQYRFPALAQKVRRIAPDAEKEDYFDSEYASDSDDARDAILPSPLPRSMKKRTSRRVSSQSFDELETPISEDNRYIDVRGLIHHASPYITLDETRASALSPSTKSVFPGLSSAKLQSSFLPNTTMHLDLKTLNLHLALRAAEVLACSESMWEWVLDYQAAAKARRANRTTRSYRSGSGSIDLPPRPSITSVSSSKDSTDSFKNSIVELTRDDFDGLLLKFEMYVLLALVSPPHLLIVIYRIRDMRDKCALGSALGERFSWSVAESSTSAARKIFNTACEKWDKWELEQSTANRGTSSAPSRHPHRPSSSHRPSSAGQTPQSLFHFSDQTNHDRGYGHEKRKTSASTLTGATLPPTHMMSRAMRVFVAWKP